MAYKASKVVVHPYRAEGFGMHVQEATACGCLPLIPANGPTDDFIPEDIWNLWCIDKFEDSSINIF